MQADTHNNPLEARLEAAMRTHELDAHTPTHLTSTVRDRMRRKKRAQIAAKTLGSLILVLTVALGTQVLGGEDDNQSVLLSRPPSTPEVASPGAEQGAPADDAMPTAEEVSDTEPAPEPSPGVQLPDTFPEALRYLVERPGAEVVSVVEPFGTANTLRVTLSPEIGGADDMQALIAALERAGYENISAPLPPPNSELTPCEDAQAPDGTPGREYPCVVSANGEGLRVLVSVGAGLAGAGPLEVEFRPLE